MSRKPPPEVLPPESAFVKFDGEAWLARRLGKHGVTALFDGLTDSAGRREKLRRAIVDNGIQDVICGKTNGKPVSYRQAFERLYGEAI